MRLLPLPTGSPCVNGQECIQRKIPQRPRNRSLFFPFLFLLALSGCGGGGGGAAGGGPLEIAYVLSEDPGNNNQGYVVEYGLNPATNQFQMSASGPLSSGGQTPIQFLINPDNTLAFVLNNNNTGGSTNNDGSIAVYQVGANGLSATPQVPPPTGPNPVNMALDPGGNYLVVANHGNGQSSTTEPGSVEVFTVNSNGQLDELSTSGSPCTYPFRIVFAPGASGSDNDIVYVTCTSPELLESSPPPASIFVCTIGELSGSGCGKPVYETSNLAFWNFVIDPSHTYAVAPGSTPSQNGSLLVCTISGTLNCSTSLSLSQTQWIPSGNIAFGGTSSSPVTYIGNYDPSSSLSENFDSCSIGPSSPNCYTSTNLRQPYPLYLATQGNVLYIADTVTPISGSYSVSINGSYSVSSSGTTTGTSPPSSGYLYACSISSSSPSNSPSCMAPSSTSSSGNTGGWPVGITFDTRNLVFVPTLSGEINIFTGASTGNLVPFQTIQNPYIPLSVTIQ
ncbi:beta-propeller fold lactonase family protein [Leptospirillum ferriphilum]|jgi:hypothetical protein|uniref:Uncharacterized protein n=2 Tax=Leptospirillum TaxID=179 RepID=A0A094YM45_9BACT|nr:beta-propeller fold lactonase family protein [Leptospirillum ferriphilum]EDZ38458.1 MAG: Hypothetical protein CGL2_10954011 [Leptospirillum sp. Group II '5-way CG']KGA94316.1 hypothetical protein LptCag_1079 [Leptospirillum ferriphilum]